MMGRAVNIAIPFSISNMWKEANQLFNYVDNPERHPLYVATIKNRTTLAHTF